MEGKEKRGEYVNGQIPLNAISPKPATCLEGAIELRRRSGNVVETGGAAAGKAELLGEAVVQAGHAGNGLVDLDKGVGGGLLGRENLGDLHRVLKKKKEKEPDPSQRCTCKGNGLGGYWKRRSNKERGGWQ
jgi:hypothetical protein